MPNEIKTWVRRAAERIAVKVWDEYPRELKPKEFAAIIAAEHATAEAGLAEAVKLFIEWDEAEKTAKPYAEDGGVGFLMRAELCRRAFDFARAALAEYEKGETDAE